MFPFYNALFLAGNPTPTKPPPVQKIAA